MEKNGSALLLRIYISNTDIYKQQLLYEWIVFQAKDKGLAGATVLKGILGYGASSVIHSYKFWELADKVPVVVEIIDKKSRVLEFWDEILPLLETMKYGCLAVTENVTTLLYKSGDKKL